ncbi:MAG: retroviral-like aspartic protease family protein [Bacteroidia bacterium]|nr:retroviral-like aspartic protease family protein [Bacteroidia bacterium]
MMKIKFLIIFLLVIGGIHFSFSQTVIKMKKESGVYSIPCVVNGLKLRFIFDTGATNVTISLTEAIFMIKNDYLNENDILGTSYAQIANGDITENTKIILRKVEFAGLTLYNVKASVVHELAAPLLFGQSAISKLGTIQINPADNSLTILNGTNTTFDYSTTKEDDISVNAQKPFFIQTNVIGKPASSIEYKDLINSINESPSVSEPMEGMKYLSFYQSGIEVLIMNNKVNTIFFHYTQVPKFNAFSGQLPKNLTWGMTKAEVYSNLGTPKESGGGGEFSGQTVPYWDKYSYANYDLHITYKSNSVYEVAIMSLE